MNVFIVICQGIEWYHTALVAKDRKTAEHYCKQLNSRNDAPNLQTYVIEKWKISTNESIYSNVIKTYNPED